MKPPRNWRLLSWATSLFVLLGSGCTDSGAAPEQRLAIVPANQVLQIPHTLQLTTEGVMQNVSWESDSPASATVSKAGLVTAHLPGLVTITVRRNGKHASTTLTIVATRVDIEPGSATLAVSRVLHVSAIARDANDAPLYNVNATWNSLNANIATVDISGNVTGVAPGTTTINASAGGAHGRLAVTVVPAQMFALNIIGDGTGAGRVTAMQGAIDCTVSQTTVIGSCSVTVVEGTPVSLHATALANAAITWTDDCTGLGPACGFIMDKPRTVRAAFTLPLAFASLESGDGHVCGLEVLTGKVYCMGANNSGQLGDGTFTNRLDLTPVQSGSVRFSSISNSGAQHTCGLDAASGRAYCWGANSDGQIGDGTTVRRELPTLVANGNLRFSSISAGTEVTCGVQAQTGTGYCWGGGGLVGDGTFLPRNTPTMVGDGRIVFSNISAGGYHVCGLEAQTSRAWCWGYNFDGELGDSTLVQRTEPTLVSGGRQYVSISAGYTHTCAIEDQSNLAYCWGWNPAGELGDGTTKDRIVPTLVNGGNKRFKSINAASYVSCGVEVLTNAGYCWGWNDYGQVGDGSAHAGLRATPTLVGNGNPLFSSLSGGNAFTCGIQAVTALGYCWGAFVMRSVYMLPTMIPPPPFIATAASAGVQRARTISTGARK